MDKIIEPSVLQGTVTVPPSKSAAHRALVCASFADGKTVIRGIGDSDDVKATLNGLSALGAGFRRDGDELTVTPVDRAGSEGSENPDSMSSNLWQPAFDCGESGTTLRFMLPLIGIEGDPVTIIVHGRLADRPNADLIRELTKHGMAFDQSGFMIEATGSLESGIYHLPGNVSSQYVSALLLALPLVAGESLIRIEGGLSSAGYVDLTRSVMHDFGIVVRKDADGYRIQHAASYRSPGIFEIEGDYSSAAFWIAANAIGNDIDLRGLKTDSYQPDAAVTKLIETIRQGGAVIDIDQMPDLLPILAVTAASGKGTTRFVNAARLRLKESDRLETVSAMINALGGRSAVDAAELVVDGDGGKLSGGTVDACGDHRIAMSAAVASCICSGPVTVRDAESVAKSYPAFWNDFTALGGRTADSS